ncbi:gamma-glutamyl-gamma-aminobutyrate hydrolase family protein, partial [Frankia sp. Cpl3]|nr:gamma-glutamyl-gamma-aminobutyrate hydrolase family protein [Frankia sp. Cpl3]
MDPAIFDLGVPVLGICYGMQLMSHLLEGKVERAGKREYGKAEIRLQEAHELYKSWEANEVVWMSHSDKVVELPRGFRVDAVSDSCPVAAISDAERKLYGVQFHPE